MDNPHMAVKKRTSAQIANRGRKFADKIYGGSSMGEWLALGGIIVGALVAAMALVP